MGLLDLVLFSYSCGLFSSLSPCVIFLIPLCVMRFVHKKGESIKYKYHSDILLFILGFQFSYLCLSTVLSSLLNSSLSSTSSGVKLALGCIFLINGILSYRNKIDPFKLPLFKSFFISGISFSLLLSFNPCTLPFLGMLITLTSTQHLILSLSSFGQGLLTPSIIVIIIGRNMLHKLEDMAFTMEKFNHIKHILLIACGIYYTYITILPTLYSYDIIWCSIGIITCLYMLIHSILKEDHIPSRHTKHNKDKEHINNTNNTTTNNNNGNNNNNSNGNHSVNVNNNALSSPISKSPDTHHTSNNHIGSPSATTYYILLLTLLSSIILLSLFLSSSYLYAHNNTTHDYISKMQASQHSNNNNNNNNNNDNNILEMTTTFLQGQNLPFMTWLNSNHLSGGELAGDVNNNNNNNNNDYNNEEVITEYKPIPQQTCYDLSMIPPCRQCDISLLIFRIIITCIAFITAFNHYIGKMIMYLLPNITTSSSPTNNSNNNNYHYDTLACSPTSSSSSTTTCRQQCNVHIMSFPSSPPSSYDYNNNNSYNYNYYNGQGISLYGKVGLILVSLFYCCSHRRRKYSDPTMMTIYSPKKQQQQYVQQYLRI